MLNPITQYRVWQCHLERISDFLLVGEGRWWHREGNFVVFHDGENDPDSLDDGLADGLHVGSPL